MMAANMTIIRIIRIIITFNKKEDNEKFHFDFDFFYSQFKINTIFRQMYLMMLDGLINIFIITS